MDDAKVFVGLSVMARFAPRKKLTLDEKGIVQTWKAEQLRRAALVQQTPLKELPRFIAGVDCAFDTVTNTRAFCTAVVFDRQASAIVEVADHVAELSVPYIPGYLAFREGPIIKETLAKFSHRYDAILFDGAGVAHPRRCGIASFLGVEMSVPCVGVAKSLLCGTFETPAEAAGSESPLLHKGERIGTILRTRDRVQPLFISVGNGIDLAGACQLVLACTRGFRLPEPTRQADINVARLKAASL